MCLVWGVLMKIDTCCNLVDYVRFFSNCFFVTIILFADTDVRDGNGYHIQINGTGVLAV